MGQTITLVSPEGKEITLEAPEQPQVVGNVEGPDFKSRALQTLQQGPAALGNAAMQTPQARWGAQVLGARNRAMIEAGMQNKAPLPMVDQATRAPESIPSLRSQFEPKWMANQFQNPMSLSRIMGGPATEAVNQMMSVPDMVVDPVQMMIMAAGAKLFESPMMKQAAQVKMGGPQDLMEQNVQPKYRGQQIEALQNQMNQQTNQVLSGATPRGRAAKSVQKGVIPEENKFLGKTIAENPETSKTYQGIQQTLDEQGKSAVLERNQRLASENKPSTGTEFQEIDNAILEEMHKEVPDKNAIAEMIRIKKQYMKRRDSLGLQKLKEELDPKVKEASRGKMFSDITPVQQRAYKALADGARRTLEEMHPWIKGLNEKYGFGQSLTKRLSRNVTKEMTARPDKAEFNLNILSKHHIANKFINGIAKKIIPQLREWNLEDASKQISKLGSEIERLKGLQAQSVKGTLPKTRQIEYQGGAPQMRGKLLTSEKQPMPKGPPQIGMRTPPKQLGVQGFNKLSGDEARSARLKSVTAQENRAKAGETLIGQRELENRRRSVGAAGAGTLAEEPAVMAPPRAAEGRAPRSTTHTEVMREEAPQNEKILQDIDWGNMTSRNPLIERLQEFKDDGTPLGKHLAEQAKALIKEIYRGEDPEAGATAREFIRSNAGVLDQKAGAHMSKGIASKSSEAPLSESKTIREGNPEVTAVGDKSVGAMEILPTSASKIEAMDAKSITPKISSEIDAVRSGPEAKKFWDGVYKKATPIESGNLVEFKEGKLDKVATVHLTKNCQRGNYLQEMKAAKAIPENFPEESCYGGACYKDRQLDTRLNPNKPKISERNIEFASRESIEKALTPERVKKINESKFIRLGQAGDDSHAIASGLAKDWLELSKAKGVTKKSVFVTSAYAPTTQADYNALAPFKDRFVIHVTESGYFSKAEILNRLNEFNKAKEAGLNVRMRVITNKDQVSYALKKGDIETIGPMKTPNEQFLFDLIKKHKIQNSSQGEVILETPYHNDFLKNKAGTERSQPTGMFKAVCCQTGKCVTCSASCLLGSKNNPSGSLMSMALAVAGGIVVADERLDKK